MIRRIGEAENPYVVRIAEEDYAGPRSIFPTPGRVLGEAENPYTVPPEGPLGGMRQLGDTDARSRWRDSPPLIKEGAESKNIEDRRSTPQGGSYTYRVYPAEKPASIKELTVPDPAEMKRRLQFQEDPDLAEQEMEEMKKYKREFRGGIQHRGPR